MEKKKVLATILSACMLTSMVGMTACGGEGGNGGGNNNADAYVDDDQDNGDDNGTQNGTHLSL